LNPRSFIPSVISPTRVLSRVTPFITFDSTGTIAGLHPMTKPPFLLVSSLLLASASVHAATLATSSWNYSIIDHAAGDAGLFVLETGNGSEIFCSSQAGASVWLALKHDPATGGYRIVHASDPVSTSGLVEFHPVQVTGDATPELVLGHEDGTIAIYDATSRALLSKMRPVNSMGGFVPRDLTGDGVPEFICFTHSALIVFDINGVEKWRVNRGGYRLVVGQMDADPALEIATTSGQVIDSGTHAVQWDHPVGTTWSPLALADIDGDGMDELITTNHASHDVMALDVDTQTVKWSVPPPPNAIHRFHAANVDDDPEPELLMSGYPGPRAFDISASGLSLKWMITNPDSSTWNLAVGEVDGDAELELVHTSGNAVGWGNRLRVADIPSLQETWVSDPFRDPFVGMCKGDVTGDGIPEYVFASGQSGGIQGGRIQVLDANTLTLAGYSGPVFDAGDDVEIRDVNLCDVDGDGRSEIAVTGIADGLFAEIYRYDPTEGFERIWSASSDSSEGGGWRIEVLDVDGNGDLEVVIAVDKILPALKSGILVFDFDSGTEQWRSPAMQLPSTGLLSLAVSDIDADGRVEAVLGEENSGFEVYDLGQRTLEQTLSVPTLTCLATRAGTPGIVVGMSDGKVVRFMKNGEGVYVGGVATTFAPESIQQVIPAFGDSMFTVVQDGIRLHQTNGSVTWQTATLFGHTSQRLMPLHTVDGWELFAGMNFGGSIFPLDAVNGQTVVDVFTSGALREGESAEASLVVTRHQAGPDDLPVRFFISGAATIGEDFQVSGATLKDGGSWEAVIPAGEASAAVNLTLVYDVLPEGEETIDFTVIDRSPYVAGPDHVAKLRIVDDEPVVGVYFLDPAISEVPSVKTGKGTDLVFLRSGNLSKSLKASFTISGTAINGKDFAKLPTSVTFKPGSDRVAIKVVAGRDGMVEGDETLTVTLAPGKTHGVKPGGETTGLTILDLANSVQLMDVVPTSKGVNLVLQRSQPLDLAQSVTVLEQRTYADGKTKTFRRKVTIAKGSYGGAVSIVGGKLPATIEWSLIDDRTFVPEGTASLVHDWAGDS
jgi:hypothetical protein